ncbi:hypothetical protein SODALDRAFT_72762 [Sodiomyces alkalinus F11]|uniref:Uncharacterized protein n=1 Tax=Sodiomyces alkalinus (strain CBS 110278 / VKM F-3762 / F11) TaxID=1314773 RepID=A0A3N2PKE8_SODAK|nr:hypothetical protein SODALDRAFT_72762 [Sodiomyces alkalinus F11]ROT34874.1 hypothetical protein SODALDRAFT_72762 [Sodiomyces alkalinus F11]
MRKRGGGTGMAARWLGELRVSGMMSPASSVGIGCAAQGPVGRGSRTRSMMIVSPRGPVELRIDLPTGLQNSIGICILHTNEVNLNLSELLGFMAVHHHAPLLSVPEQRKTNTQKGREKKKGLKVEDHSQICIYRSLGLRCMS